MKKWTLVDETLTPDGKTVSLHEHDGEYSIRVGAAELMSTRQHASEEKAAQLACSHLKGKGRARVLIGGLGFGFTLKAALAVLDSDAEVVTAEILGAVVVWNRDPAFHLACETMEDARVSIVLEDVAEVIRRSPGGFDAIVLDVDNGPAALSNEGNRRLYDYEGLKHIRAALRPGGCVTFWSAVPDVKFEKLMARAGFAVSVERCRARASGGSRHIVFVGLI